jgi:micrococcal nuclease
MRAAPVAIAGLGLLVTLPACTGDRCGPAHAAVARVIDGDTIELDSSERVRYLLVDTPESTTQVECYGPEAKQFNQDLVAGKEIDLVYDTQCTDRYDRLLAYVSVSDREVNSILVERGFACVLHIPPNGASRVDEFRTLQSVARSEMRGLWGVCPENPCN